MKPRICYGATTPSEWTKHPGENHIFVTVDTSHCGFKKTPLYICSLVGDSQHWSTTGGNSVYRPTKDGFNVHVRHAALCGVNGECVKGKLTVELACKEKWAINWIAIEEPECELDEEDFEK